MFYIFIEIVFTIGLFINAALFIPQAIKLYQKKDSEEISLLTFIGFTVINLFTTLHGLIKSDYLLFFGSLFSLLTCGAVSVLAVFYRLKFTKKI